MSIGRKPIAYLTEREQVTKVYRKTQLTVMLPAAAPSEPSPMWLTAHTSNMPATSSLRQKLAYVRQGVGEAGSCIDYVTANTYALGVPDQELGKLVDTCEERTPSVTSCSPRLRWRSEKLPSLTRSVADVPEGRSGPFRTRQNVAINPATPFAELTSRGR